MNLALTEEIVKHILANLNVIGSDFVNVPKSGSLINDKYILPIKLQFETDVSQIENRVWGCQFVIEHKNLKIILGDASISRGFEYCLIIHLEGMPSYGLYINITDRDEPSQAMIAFSINGLDWAQCNTYLQATFLAAMEQLKDIIGTQQKCVDFKEEYQSMLSFIKYHTNTFEEDYEGQES